MALIPVWSGTFTGCRSATPGAVERNAQRVDHAADDFVSDGHPQQLAGAADRVAFGNLEVVAQDDYADRRLFEVEHLSAHAVFKLDHLAGHCTGQAVHAGNAVAHLDHATDLDHLQVRAVLLDLTL